MSSSYSHGMPTTAEAKRDAVRLEELVTLDEMSSLLRCPRPQVEALPDRGRLFTIDVDDSRYIPAFLNAETTVRARLWDICEIIQPAAPESRLEFLLGIAEAPWDRNALDLLADEQAYRRLRAFARAWASKWSRTLVTLFDGKGEAVRWEAPPLFEAIGEVDPRYPVWSRANRALGHNEFWRKQALIGCATLLICRDDPPGRRTIEKRLVLTIADSGTSLFIGTGADEQQTFLLPLPCTSDVHDASQIVRIVVRQMERGGEAAGVSVRAAAQILGCGSNTVHELLLDRRLAPVSATHGKKPAVTLASIRAYRMAAVAQAHREKASVAQLQ
ncbi:hypothetical protein [Caballeronia sp. NCTM5]|uniref:hypothetical protein n=1 Tax=Caballeronia sp. NCTM5 TaxID=2921755 RepID=UPI0020284460|nr:hypothetical protein [Caballeronia sp. NCTM5]